MIHSYIRQFYLKKSQGFTLLELLIVCCLISLFLVVSVPAVHNGLLNNSLKSDCRKLIGLVRGVRELAIREYQPYLLKVDFSEGKVWYKKDSLETNDKTIEESFSEPKLILSSDVEFEDIWSKSVGTINKGVVEMWISNQGYMEKHVIHIRSGEEKLSLVLRTFSPEVDLHEGYFESD